MGGLVSTLQHNVTPAMAVAIAIPLGAGTIVGAAQAKATIEWYPTLDKPSWTPPAPLFGNLWSIFYAVMGYASYLVWQHGGIAAQRPALTLYGLQLGFNLAWPVVFFIKKKLWAAQFVNLGTLAFAAATARAFYRVEPRAGKLLIPYLVWLAFANALNYSIAKKNPGADLPASVREDNYRDPSKKNPGERGYGPGGSTTMASAYAQPARAQRLSMRPVPSNLRSQPQLGQRLPLLRRTCIATASAHTSSRVLSVRCL